MHINNTEGVTIKWTSYFCRKTPLSDKHFFVVAHFKYIIIFYDKAPSNGQALFTAKHLLNKFL